MKVQVQNMTSSNGNAVPNQFVIITVEEDGGTITYFQSYTTIIAKREYFSDGKTCLDRNKWDYSVTTGKYRNQFLGETKKETQKKIDSGEYILTDLN